MDDTKETIEFKSAGATGKRTPEQEEARRKLFEGIGEPVEITTVAELLKRLERGNDD